MPEPCVGHRTLAPGNGHLRRAPDTCVGQRTLASSNGHLRRAPDTCVGQRTLASSNGHLRRAPNTCGGRPNIVWNIQLRAFATNTSVQIDMTGASVRKTQGFSRCRTRKWKQISMDETIRANCTVSIQKNQYGCKKTSTVYGKGEWNEYSQG